ncbi:IS4 family transposase [Bacteroidia bacterium]|nr:IS4 family transposase [Bacteroidia bacterium]
MKEKGTPIEEDERIPKFSAADLKESRVLEHGLLDVLRQNAEQLGLRDVLKAACGKFADEIFMLASHLVASGEPYIYTQEWLKNSDVTEPVGELSSSQITRILANISQTERDGFYREWAKLRADREYLALDITSSSSYSELIDDVEWGHNRDGEDLPQVSICLLMGETSRLPVYQTVYAGSLNDVSTLKTTLAKFDAITDNQPILTVMDKGFYSKRNVESLLSDGKRFIISMPFSAAAAKKLVVENSATIDDFDNSLAFGLTTLRAVTRQIKINKYDVSAHIYFNPIKAAADKEKLILKVSEMRTNAEINPEKYIDDKDFSKYLNIEKSEGGYTVSVKKDAIADAVKHAGWLVIISNHIHCADEALRIYRGKDVVEKGFLKLKNSIDIGRLRVHSDNAMHNKVFIGFVALVLMSHIHAVMCDKALYKKYTMKQLLRTLAKRKVILSAQDELYTPLQKNSAAFTRRFR